MCVWDYLVPSSDIALKQGNRTWSFICALIRNGQIVLNHLKYFNPRLSYIYYVTSIICIVLAVNKIFDKYSLCNLWIPITLWERSFVVFLYHLEMKPGPFIHGPIYWKEKEFIQPFPLSIPQSLVFAFLYHAMKVVSSLELFFTVISLFFLSTP